MSLLIPKMLTFTLAISCFTKSSVPWFMDLTFQILMQYCPLRHPTLLSLYFHIHNEAPLHFGPATSFFLELLVTALCSSPVAYWTPPDQEVYFLVSYLFTFSYCSWVSPGKNTGVGCHFLLQWTVFCQNSSLWPVCLGEPCTAPSSWQGCDPWRILRDRNIPTVAIPKHLD